MQHRVSFKFGEEQGFATSRIQVKQQPRYQPHLAVKHKLSSPKELIDTVRPEDFHPRVLENGTQITLLPQYMNTKEQQGQEVSNSGISLTKIQYNGKGKTLYDYFISSDFVCIYDKYKDKRAMKEIYYDFTSRIKIIEQTNDYNWKLYKKLGEPNMEPSLSMRNLQFDSNFQSGNARYIYKQYSKLDQYYVLLENDTNTHGYNQWFFFRVRNKIPEEITINIMNMIKRRSLYKQGMKIAIFSTKEYEINKRGWYRGGTNIGYSNTGIERTTKQNENHYALSFNYAFEHQEDCVYFALTIPYTYSRMGLLLNEIEQRCLNHKIAYRQKTLGYTLSNNRISMMKIGFSNQSNKKSIVILSRQHPCETMGSFVCEGFVKELTSNSPQSISLLKDYCFVIVPMVNPDGVIEGNSRCNLSGIDLNRQWSQPIKQLTPETFYIKRYLQKLHQQNTIETIIDLHGHSKKYEHHQSRTNSFFYCCEKKDRSQMRLLSILMSRLCRQFDYTSCTYGLTRDKISTIRGKFSSFGIDCYTLENSYFGWYDEAYHGFTGQSFDKIGESLLKSLFLIYSSSSSSSLDLGYDFNKTSVMEQIKKNIFKLEAEQKGNREDSGSDSDPDGDLFDMEERLDTLKMKSLLKSNSNKTMLKGLTSVSKTVKYQSPLVVQYQKLQKDEKKHQTVQLKRRKKGKHSLNLQPEDFILLDNNSTIVKKATQTSVRAKKDKIIYDKPDVSKQTRLASSLNKPSRLQYFTTQQDKSASGQITKVHSNHHLEQPPLIRNRPASSYRTQAKFLSTALKNKSRASTKFHTEGDDMSFRRKLSKMDDTTVNQYRSKSPNEKDLKIIEVAYLQQRRQRMNFIEDTGIFKSREMRRSNLISDTKFKRFQNFLDNNADKVAPNVNKNMGNRVFYRFPVL